MRAGHPPRTHPATPPHPLGYPSGCLDSVWVAAWVVGVREVPEPHMEGSTGTEKETAAALLLAFLLDKSHPGCFPLHPNTNLHLP